MRRARPVCVQAERPPPRDSARALEPTLDILTEGGVRRTHERDQIEATGAASLQFVEPRPRVVAERLLGLAGDNRDWRARHTVAHVRDLRTLFAVERAAAAARRRNAR